MENLSAQAKFWDFSIILFNKSSLNFWERILNLSILSVSWEKRPSTVNKPFCIFFLLRFERVVSIVNQCQTKHMIRSTNFRLANIINYKIRSMIRFSHFSKIRFDSWFDSADVNTWDSSRDSIWLIFKLKIRFVIRFGWFKI